MSSCKHDVVSFCSIKRPSCSYVQPSEQQRQEALQVTGPAHKPTLRGKKEVDRRIAISTLDSHGQISPSSTFPAPLVFPGDELDGDPECPPQSLQDWLDEDDRNDVTTGRRIIYVVQTPLIAEEVAYVNEWAQPKSKDLDQTSIITPPETANIVDYLRAFYHGLPVKLLSKPRLEFTAWGSSSETSRSKKNLGKRTWFVGLSTGSEVIRVRCRTANDGLFSAQLNLDDLLDVAIAILPEAAYALVMIVNQDLFEGEDDDFCCGRAYGGSRVAVVSTARYRPGLEPKQDQMDLAHAWPASHCARYVARQSGIKVSAIVDETQDRENTQKSHAGNALAAAIDATSGLPMPTTLSELKALWLSRVCKTVSHELGHCFGIDHCVYYACVMQGSANMAEDFRQPPYLCPIDLSKVLRATGADGKERYAALIRHCDSWIKDRMFAAFGAWLRVRLGEGNIES